jgi:molybdate transport system regulatory protein
MSYRAVWGKIKATEDRLGQSLLTKRTGGSHGGGSELTPLTRALINRHRHLDDLIQTTSDTLFQGIFVDALAGRGVEAAKKED